MQKQDTKWCRNIRISKSLKSLKQTLKTIFKRETWNKLQIYLSPYLVHILIGRRLQRQSVLSRSHVRVFFFFFFFFSNFLETGITPSRLTSAMNMFTVIALVPEMGGAANETPSFLIVLLVKPD